MNTRRRNLGKERGFTLLTGLIILMMIMLLGVASFNFSKSNLKIVSNMQTHEEVVSTAQGAIEEVLSKTYFSETPDVSFGTTNTKTYSVNGRSNAITVTLDPPPCIKYSEEVPASPTNPDDQGCIAGASQTFGVAGSGTSSSCIDVIWEVTAVATDNATEASATVVQGIKVRQDSGWVSTSNFCS